mmetsp:Transcript_14687/g.28951  ORF Transcript_14687/g.28951 Transcript_14687/m.28951 type:complete len:430 (-) Transcript_14687:41-1330(-)
MSAKHTDRRGRLPVVLLLASCTGAVRDSDFLNEGRSWERKTYEFCVNEGNLVECGGVSDEGGNVDQVIDDISVWYNRKTMLGTKAQHNVRDCQKTDASISSAKSCVADYVGNLEKCKGRQSCFISPSDHPHCDREEFSCLRLRITCGTGKPTDVLEPTDPSTRQAVQIGCTKNSQGQCVDTDKGSESEVRQEETTTTTPQVLVVEVAAQLGEVRHKVQKEVENPYLIDIELVPCYRWKRHQKIFEKHEIFGSWKHYEFLARLTDCGHEEGCFMVKFPNGAVYSDENEVPTSSEIAKGELEKADDNFWVTWRGIGLKRNDYNTWGVCLPKTRSMDFAVLQWEFLREKALIKESEAFTDDQKDAVYRATGEHVSTGDEAREAFQRLAQRQAAEELPADQKLAVYKATGEHVSTRQEAKEAFKRWVQKQDSS